MKNEKRAYNCSYELLYIICALGWDFCLKNLPAFAKFRKKYTPGYILAAKDAIEAAEKIKDVDVRNANGKKARIIMDAALKQVCSNWQELKRYISVASAPEMEYVNLQLAGFNHYEKASRGKWEAGSALIKNGNDFIVKNLTMLLADDNMPADFADLFKTDGEMCSKLAAECLDTGRNKPIETKDKQTANNEIYEDLMVMFSDAQRIYATNESMARQFTVTYLTELGNGRRAGSIKGAVVDAFTGKPVENAIITVENEKYMGKSTKKGRYNMKRVAGGTYTVLTEVAGYQPLSMKVTVKPGTAATCNVSLTAAESLLKVA